MIKIKPLPGFDDIVTYRTTSTFLGRPLMWAWFLRVDNVFIDTGNAGCDRKALRRHLNSLPADRDWVVLHTHLHEDHCGNDDLFVETLGARVIAAGTWCRKNFSDINGIFRFFWGRPRIFEHTFLKETELMTDQGRRLRVIPTPGHTRCHYAIKVEPDGVLVTGDAVPLATRKLYSMPEEDYRRSLATLCEIGAMVEKDPTLQLFTSHKGLLRDAGADVEARIRAMQEVIDEVVDAWERTGNIKQTVREALGPARWRDLLLAPRISLDNTAASILKGRP